MRKQPGTPPAIAQRDNNSIVTQVREYELITPLFGGGVSPRESDPVTIIRGTEIRGQLRFWWRACRGGQFNGDLAKLKQEEDKIWGAAYEKGKESISQNETVQIVVDVISPGTSKSPFERQNGRTRSIQSVAPSYAAFPLQPSDEENQANSLLKTVRQNVSFRLMISFPTSQRTELEAALWAWETFGGVGARTRRGFGALHLLKIDNAPNADLPSSNQPFEWVNRKLKQFVEDDQYPEGLPHLSTKTPYRCSNSFRNPMDAWRWLIRRLSEFRQIPDGRSGRSLWPEAEAIRNITSRRFYKYSARAGSSKFPRAVFGLPIIFHFKDPGDPEDTTLQGVEEGSERLASPLILRPLSCKDGQAVGIALLLEGCHLPPGGIELAEKSGKTHSVDATLTRNEANTIPVLKGETNVLQAFLNYLGGNTR
jgi:CRISPR-associated protein Cmr1